ncbi:hypothetical protein STEG23_038212, partial [Scotinomys teguina]
MKGLFTFSSLASQMPQLLQNIHGIIEAFSCYARSEGGCKVLTRGELKRLLEHEFADIIVNPHDPSTVDEILRLLDEDNTGTVEFKEFLVLVFKVARACFKTLNEIPRGACMSDKSECYYPGSSKELELGQICGTGVGRDGAEQCYKDSNCGPRDQGSKEQISMGTHTQSQESYPTQVSSRDKEVESQRQERVNQQTQVRGQVEQTPRTEDKSWTRERGSERQPQNSQQTGETTARATTQTQAGAFQTQGSTCDQKRGTNSYSQDRSQAGQAATQHYQIQAGSHTQTHTQMVEQGWRQQTGSGSIQTQESIYDQNRETETYSQDRNQADQSQAESYTQTHPQMMEQGRSQQAGDSSIQTHGSIYEENRRTDIHGQDSSHAGQLGTGNFQTQVGSYSQTLEHDRSQSASQVGTPEKRKTQIESGSFKLGENKMTDLLRSVVSVIDIFYKYTKQDGECGTLSKDELKELLEKEFRPILKNPDDPDTVDVIMHMLDRDHDRRLDFTEFLLMIFKLAMACNKVLGKEYCKASGSKKHRRGHQQRTEESETEDEEETPRQKSGLRHSSWSEEEEHGHSSGSSSGTTKRRRRSNSRRLERQGELSSSEESRKKHHGFISGHSWSSNKERHSSSSKELEEERNNSHRRSSSESGEEYESGSSLNSQRRKGHSGLSHGLEKNKHESSFTQSRKGKEQKLEPSSASSENSKIQSHMCGYSNSGGCCRPQNASSPCQASSSGGQGNQSCCTQSRCQSGTSRGQSYGCVSGGQSSRCCQHEHRSCNQSSSQRGYGSKQCGQHQNCGSQQKMGSCHPSCCGSGATQSSGCDQHGTRSCGHSSSSHQEGCSSNEFSKCGQHRYGSGKSSCCEPHGRNSNQSSGFKQHGHGSGQSCCGQHGATSGQTSGCSQQGSHLGQSSGLGQHGSGPSQSSSSEQHGSHSGQSPSSGKHGSSSSQSSSSEQHGSSSGQSPRSGQHGSHSGQSPSSGKHGSNSSQSSGLEHHGSIPSQSSSSEQHGSSSGQSPRSGQHGSHSGQSPSSGKRGSSSSQSSGLEHHGSGPGQSSSSEKHGSGFGQSSGVQHHGYGYGQSPSYGKHGSSSSQSSGLRHHGSGPSKSSSSGEHGSGFGKSSGVQHHGSGPGQSPSSGEHESGIGQASRPAQHEHNPGDSSENKKHGSGSGPSSKSWKQGPEYGQSSGTSNQGSRYKESQQEETKSKLHNRKGTSEKNLRDSSGQHQLGHEQPSHSGSENSRKGSPVDVETSEASKGCKGNGGMVFNCRQSDTGHGQSVYQGNLTESSTSGNLMSNRDQSLVTPDYSNDYDTKYEYNIKRKQDPAQSQPNDQSDIGHSQYLSFQELSESSFIGNQSGFSSSRRQVYSHGQLSDGYQLSSDSRYSNQRSSPNNSLQSLYSMGTEE